MPLVKILKDYKPSEGWKVGEIVDVTDPWALIDQGKAVLVDEDGNEIERPGLLKCPICSFDTKNALALANHIIDEHPRKGAQPAAVRVGDRPEQKVKVKAGLAPEEALAKLDKITGVEPESDEEAKTRKEEVRRQRLLNLAKARAAKKASATKKRAEKIKAEARKAGDRSK